MTSNVPFLILNNGQKIPQLGLGTWNSPSGEVAQAVKDAIDIGYRHFDCAHVYGNEKEIGEAIAAKIAEGVVKREDLFITSKLWCNAHRKDLVVPAIKKTLENLNTSYVDLYLVHWPFAYKEGEENFPRGSDGKILFSDVDYLETWAEMEKLTIKGLAKSVGVSNFSKAQLERLWRHCEIRPVANQVECHPYLAQQKLSKFLESYGVVLTAYSPLGSPGRPWATSDEPHLLTEPKVLEIAKKYNKTPAQVLIRYQLQRGHVVIPKSVTKDRIKLNFQVYDFGLTPEEMKSLNSLDCGRRVCDMTGDLDSTGHFDYPFNDEY